VEECRKIVGGVVKERKNWVTHVLRGNRLLREWCSEEWGVREVQEGHPLEC